MYLQKKGMVLLVCICLSVGLLLTTCSTFNRTIVSSWFIQLSLHDRRYDTTKTILKEKYHPLINIKPFMLQLSCVSSHMIKKYSTE